MRWLSAVPRNNDTTTAPQDDGLPPLREVIADCGLFAKKSLGQSFLLDFNLTRRIARAGGPLEAATILEIGPGPGGLTRALLAEGAGHLIVIEKDERTRPALEAIAAHYTGKLTIVWADAMDIVEAQLLKGHKAVRVVANLPYNVGTALTIKWLTVADWPPWWLSLTLMFQREVAERMVAATGSSAYGRLSVLTQWRAKPQILFDVHPRNFTPPPKVTSSVLRIDPLLEPIAPCGLDALQRVTASAFGQRRKMLRASLKTLTPRPEPLIEAAGLSPSARAQDIPVEGFAALARALDASSTVA